MYFKGITAVFGDSFTEFEYSFTMTIRYATTTLFNIFFGFLVNKFGTKKLMSAGFLSLISFAVINSLATRLVHFYIASIFLGMGLSWTTTTMVSVVINNWVTKNKATITGAVLAANGLGGALASQIVSPIIFSGEPYGYRNAYRLVAIILSVVFLLILIFFRDTPKGVERKPVPLHKKRKIRGSGWVGMEFSEVKKKPYFYLAIICMLFTGMTLNGLGEITSLHMYDLEIDKAFIANLATLSSLCLMSSKFINGFIYDRIGIKKTMNICYACAFIALICITMIANTTTGKVFATVRIFFASIA